MAAPAVAGMTALVVAEAQGRGISLGAQEIRDILIGAARKNPPAGAGGDARYGHGRASAASAVAAVMELAPAPKRRRATRKPPTRSKRPKKKARAAK